MVGGWDMEQDGSGKLSAELSIAYHLGMCSLTLVCLFVWFEVLGSASCEASTALLHCCMHMELAKGSISLSQNHGVRVQVGYVKAGLCQS